ncbi:MAG: FHA domain-containing protein, partial [Myxococcota bacterium]
MSTNVSMTFRIYAGDELVRTEELEREIIKIGKLQTSHLRIDDPNVSRMHAVIEVSGPEEVFIIDLGSASGTIVNGSKVNKTKLSSGDTLQLGDTRVEVEISEAKAAKEPAAAAAPAAAPVANPFAARAPAPAAPANPFATPLAAAAASAPVDPEQVQYGLVASGPPVAKEEVETTEQAVEVSVLWGDRQVLHVEHQNPIRAFYVGEPGGKGQETDFLLGADVLGAARMPLVVPAGAGVAAVIPAGATGTVTVGDATQTLEQLAGKLQPCGEAPGAKQYPVPANAIVRVEHKGFTFVTKPVQAGKKIGGGFSVDWGPLSYVLGSMALFGILLTIMYFIPEPAGGLNLDLLNTDSRLVKYLMEPPATEEEETPEWLEES